MSPEYVKSIDQLADKVGDASRADIVRDALALLFEYVSRMEQGYSNFYEILDKPDLKIGVVFPRYSHLNRRKE